MKLPEKLKFIFLLSTAAAIGIFTNACDETNLNKDDEEIIGVPPSISEQSAEEIKFVNLTEEQSDELKIEVQVISKEITNHILAVPGFVFPAPENISIISAPLDGRVAKIYAHEGERVNRGESLLELESIEYGNLVAEYLQANADKTYQENKLERIKSLVDKKISSKSDLDKAEAEFLRASASLRASYSKLKAVGTIESEIENLANSASINPRLKVISPISGTIDQHLIDLGQSVLAYDKMLSVIDLNKVLIRGYVSPEDGPLLKVGNTIKITQKNNPMKFLRGSITTINPALDETNKSIVINCVVDTKDQWPKPGENLRVEVAVKTSEPMISIPLSAIAYDGDKSVVFVRKSPNKFEQRAITIDKIYDQSVIISKGLNEGEEIAVNQIFSLKALLRFEDYAEE